MVCISLHCLHSDKVEIFPHFLKKIIKIPLVMGRDWYSVWNLVDNVQLLMYV